MSRGSKTKDELFILSLYEHSAVSEQHQMICPYFVGKSIGQSEKTVNSILRQLTRSNFVKKHGDREISLTDKGRELVEVLQT